MTQPPRDPLLEAKRQALASGHGISEEEAELLTRDAATLSLFEVAVGTGGEPGPVANLLINELPRETQGVAPEEVRITGEGLAELVGLLETGTISSSGGREVLARLVRAGGSPAAIVEELGLRQVSDAASLRPLVEEVLREFPEKTAEYRAGKTGLMGFFIGQVMRRSGGKANPEVVRGMVEERLAS